MNEQDKTLGGILSSYAPTGKAAEETLHAIVLGDADAIVVQTKEGPRVYTLRDAGEPYRELVERMPGAAVIVDADHTILYCNGGLSRMLGREGLAGGNVLDIVAPDHRQKAKGLISAAACGRFNTEIELIAEGGAKTRVQASAAPMSFDGQPCIALVVTALDDIDALRESEHLLRLFIEHAPAGIVMLDRDLRYLAVSKRWLQNYGINEEIIGRSHYEILPEITDAMKAMHQRCLAGAVERLDGVPFHRADGRVQWLRCEIRPWRDGRGEIGGILIASEDVSESHNAEQALRQSDAYSRSLFESSPDCVKVVSLDGRLEQMNGNGRCIMEITDFEAVRGSYWPDLWPREARAGLEAAMTEARAGRTGHFSGFRPSGSGVPRWWDVMITAIPGADGAPARLIAASRDITGRKLAEETLRKNETLTRLAADAARMTYAEFDFKTGRLNLAENFASVMGYAPRALASETDLAKINADLLAHVAPEDHAVVQAANRAFVGGKLDGSVTYRVIGDDGATRWIEGRWTAEADENGWPARGIAASLDITERKRAEDSLRENQQRSQLATEATGVGVWEWNVRTDAVWWDRQMFSLYGIPPTEDGFVSNETWAAAVLPEDFPEQDRRLRKLAREGGTNRREFRLRRRDTGEIRVIEAVETIRADSSGQTQWVVGTNLDVTERKRAEQALQESDDRLRMALSGAKAAAWQWNIVTNELIWSPECFEIYGRNPERDLAKYEIWRECLHPDDLEPTERIIREIIRQRKPDYRTEYRVILPSGAIRWLAALGKVEFAADGTPKQMSGINLDITEQKQAEQRLEESETRFRAAQEASLDAFLICEPIKDEGGKVVDLNIVYINPMAAKYCRSTPERMEGRLISETLPGAKLPGGLIDQHGRIIESGQTQEYFLDYDADGVKGHFRNLVAPFGRYAAATFRDITEEVESAEALAAAKAEAERANQTKSKFLAAASHDLRQPVQSLVLLMSLIERQVPEKSKPAETVKMMRAAVNGLHGLLTSVLDISRLDAGVVTPIEESIDLSDFVRKLASEYALKAADKALEFRWVPGSLHVRTDRSLLERAVRNLIENALRYTPDGGILLGVRRRGAQARIDVIDTGVGIPASKQSEIFEEFHQLSNPGRNLEMGLGLGLAIVGRLATLLGAEIEVASRPERGSRFSLSLPMDCEGAPAVAAAPAINGALGRILIIEDNAIVRHGLEAMLREWGHETVAAGCGEDALDMAARDNWRFDIIVADYRLGAGLTGVQTAQEIRRRAGRALPSIVLTGDTDRERIAEIDASGFEMLHKPVGAEDLRLKLAQLILLGMAASVSLP